MKVQSLSPVTRIVCVLLASLGPFVFAVSPANAEVVHLKQKHSKDDVDKACQGVGGLPVEGEGGDGYGCYNPNNGVLVACDKGEQCVAFIPGKKRMSSNSKLRDFMSLGQPPVATTGGKLTKSPFQ